MPSFWHYFHWHTLLQDIHRSDGAVWFGHWGCKHTLGAAQLAKKKFEEAGLPLLILDGDGCDRSHGGEGQTSTRLGAFLEMLGGAENE